MKKGMLLLLPVLFGIGFLQGCAPPSPALVRDEGPDRQYAFKVEEDYHSVYEKILTQAKKCFYTYKISGQMTASGEMNEETKTGTITVSYDGILATDTYQVIDVHAVSGNASLVIAYYSLGSVEENGAALREWVLDNSTRCLP